MNLYGLLDHRAHVSLRHIMLAGLVLAAGLTLLHGSEAGAFTNRTISPISADMINTSTGAADGTVKHVLKHENSSTINRVDMVAYYDRNSVNAGQTITIRDRDGDPQRCHTYPDGNSIANFIRVTLSIDSTATGTGRSVTYVVPGDQVCVPAPRNNTIALRNNSYFFAQYPVPSGFTLAQMGAPDPETNLYKVDIRIEYAPGVQQGTTGSDDDLKQQVAFRVGISTPPCGASTPSNVTSCARYLGVKDITASDGTNRNFSTLGTSNSAAWHYTRQYFNFGLPCSGAAVIPRTVTVYDVDNGNPLWNRMHIRIEKSTNGGASYTPLSTTSGGAEQLVVTGPGYTTSPQGAVANARIQPADGDRTAMNIRFTLQPGTNYRIVADSVHSRNLFGLGLPTETIFGVLDCRYNLLPNITVGSTVLAPGGTIPSGIVGGVQNSGTVTSYGSSANAVVRFVLPRGTGTLVRPGAGATTTPNSAGFGCRLADWVADGVTNCTDRYTNATGRSFPTGSTTIFNGGDPLTGVTLEPGDRVCYMTVVNLYGQTAQPNNWRYSNTLCIVTAKRPSVQIWGNDLRVGGRYASDTTNTDNASIQTALMRMTNYYGSWTEYGVLAPGVVSGMASGSGLANGNPSNVQSQWSRLTFANSTSDTRCLTSGAGCFTDSVRMGTLPDVNQGIVNGAFSGVPVTENTTGTIGAQTIANARIERRLGGTIEITGNIQAAPGPYANERSIPQLIIIADRINIRSNVTRVDAWLIATGTNAVINTCSDGPANLTQADCDEQLTVNGPTIAKTLLMRRTAGGDSVATADDPAERFNLRADTYLWAYDRAQRTGSIHTTYIRELAPRY